MTTIVLICVCGGLGSVTRFMLNTSIQRWWGRIFPLSTLTINVIAGFCAGIAAAGFAYQTVDHHTYLLFVTGFLGGFSTFSTAINEIASLTRTRRAILAVSYCLATVVVPVACAALGWLLVAVAH